MTPFLLYIARASLYLALFYAFFLLVMRRTSLFRFNRIALLAGTVVCHLLPFLRLRTVILPEVAIPVSPESLEAVGEPVGASAPPFPWLPVLYAAGVLAILVLCLLSAVRTRRIIRSGVQQPCEGCRLTLVERDLPSFSWGRRVVMSRSDYEKYPAILAHELQHIRCRHSLDILLMTAVTALHWFNPLVWIARAELKLLHEYEADESLIRQGIDVTSYQLLLVRKAVGEQRFSLANGFNHAKLKQRITMMQHKPTSGWMRLAYVALLPFLAGTMFLCNPARAEIRPATPGDTAVVQDDDPPVPYSQIEKKPTFQGEDASTFGRWVAQHLNYPAEAKEAGIQGRVMVSFDICDDGVVRNVRVLRSVHETLDAEAVRVISSSPKWEPGEQAGKPVKVSYAFPVIFLIRDGEQTVKSAVGEPRDPEARNEMDGVVVVSYGDSKGTSENGETHSVRIRKAAGAEGDPIIYLDGEKFSGNISDIDVSTVQSMEVLKDAAAVEKYGEEAKNGVILIKTKK